MTEADDPKSEVQGRSLASYGVLVAKISGNNRRVVTTCQYISRKTRGVSLIFTWDSPIIKSVFCNEYFVVIWGNHFLFSKKCLA